ncbi:MAG: hypothetical protein Q9217_001750 [Psora testacea]
MRRCKQPLTATQALQRVFLPFLNQCHIGLTVLRPACASNARFYHRSAIPFPPHPYALPAQRPFQPDLRLNPNNFGPKDQVDARARDLRDELIRAFKVYVVQPNDSLGEPVLLRDALDARQFDERGKPTQYLRQVREPDDEFPYPVCKYYDVKLERDRELAKKKAAKTAKTENKQLEINWTVSDNDLGHRMGRLKEFLEKGWKVEVVLGSTRKKGWKEKRMADSEEAKNLINRIKAAAMEVDGARERTGMKGVLGQEAVLSFEGIKKKAPAVTTTAAAE